MSNFTPIPPPWQALAQNAIDAEQQVYAAPRYTAMLCRTALEEWVRWLYRHDEDLEIPYDDNLSNLIHQEAFQRLLPAELSRRLNLIRKTGNKAVHTNQPVKPDEALHMVKLLHGFMAWVVALYSPDSRQLPAFDSSLVPRQPPAEKTRQELQALEERYHATQAELQQALDELSRYKAVKETNITRVPSPPDPDEAFTRKLYIDVLLREAGWQEDVSYTIEYPLHGCMPRPDGTQGDGYADYVLWGADGRPLAVVEAKRTARDARVGQQQAALYATCLEQKFGRRPVVFYTNGYETWLWDDRSYPPRMVYGFYTRDELELLLHRRDHRQPLREAKIDTDITDRHYQIASIRAVGEAFDRQQRQALLVMATGTGKTRVAAAIVDMLSKAGLVKRVLFLADRNALVHQAKRSFNDYLPHMPAIDLTREAEDDSSRIIFSTYQTMIRQIDTAYAGDHRLYGPGHFDLIIFDEIHRSVYNRYQYIFRYFDGLRLGLTATPRAEADRDTYALFGLQAGDPTYAYELDQAIRDGYLVPPVATSVPLKFQRAGIKYSELTDEEKREYEAQFADPVTGAFPDEIDATALNQWLFNQDTVDKVLAHLMSHGIHIEGGEKLGKTILFARSHAHALFIEERFNAQYPAYRGQFLRIIDYQQEYRHTLLDHFKSPDKMPQIAVSVDMLDTGIDVPEVTNLVFFKPVRSRTKFWQMIGRGTRLCPDLLGPGLHKQNFYIFDFCENFEFFGTTPAGVEASIGRSLSQRLFELRLRLSQLLLRESDEALQAYGREMVEGLIAQVQALPADSFLVRQHLRDVERFQEPARWASLDDLDLRTLIDNIAPLVREVDQDELAKRFDLMMLTLQRLHLEANDRAETVQERVREIARKLSQKTSIPAVAARLPILEEIQRPVYWENAGILGYERIRRELRDLMRFLDREQRPVVYTNFNDDIGEPGIVAMPWGGNDLEVYKRKVEQYIREHQHHLVIHKLRTNQPVTPAEIGELERMLLDQGILETHERFVEAYGDQPLGRFIRSLLGLDRQAAKEAFAALMQDAGLNVRQIHFLEKIINSFVINGIVAPERLFEPPFTEIHEGGVTGLFDHGQAVRIISLMQEVNRRGEVG